MKPAALALIATGVVLPETVGFVRDDYSAAADYLSELGAEGAPYASLINLVGFLPVGLLIIVLVTALWSRLPGTGIVRAGLFCLLGVAVGYLGAVVFRCEDGCESGSTAQLIHNLTALLEYIGAAIGLLLIAVGARMDRTFSVVTLIAAALVVVAFLLLVLQQLPAASGAVQRVADYSVFLWFLFAAFRPAR